MDDFEEKLNSILSSPEAMGQIMALADSLTGQADPGTGDAAPPGHPTAGSLRRQWWDGAARPVRSGLRLFRREQSPGHAPESGPGHAPDHRHPLSRVQPVGRRESRPAPCPPTFFAAGAVGEGRKSHPDHSLVPGDPGCHAAVPGERLCITNSFPRRVPPRLPSARHAAQGRPASQRTLSPVRSALFPFGQGREPGRERRWKDRAGRSVGSVWAGAAGSRGSAAVVYPNLSVPRIGG